MFRGFDIFVNVISHQPICLQVWSQRLQYRINKDFSFRANSEGTGLASDSVDSEV